MLIISGSGQILQAVQAGATTTSNPSFFLSYTTLNMAAMVQANNASGALNGVTPVTLLAGTSNQLLIKQIDVFNSDTVAQTITVNVSVSAAIKNLYQATLQPGDSLHYLDGPGWFTTKANGSLGIGPSNNNVNIQVFSTAGNQMWIKPTTFKPSFVNVICIGAGGSGGSGASGTSGTGCTGGCGGGGGAYATKFFNASDLPATVPLVVGAGGASVNGGTNIAGTTGNLGGASMFGSTSQSSAYLFAGAGGPGTGGAITAVGGAGGGSGGTGSSSTSTPGTAGTPWGANNAQFTQVYAGCGTQVTQASVGYGEYGGGGGGSSTGANASAGGPSVYGGGGGGHGGVVLASTVVVAAAAGGCSGTAATGLNAGGGAPAGLSGPFSTNGSNGTSSMAIGSTTILSGSGGGGGGSTATTGENGGTGGTGGYPGGGGGGGGATLFQAGTEIGGTSGRGGDGCVFVSSW